MKGEFLSNIHIEIRVAGNLAILRNQIGVGTRQIRKILQELKRGELCAPQ